MTKVDVFSGFLGAGKTTLIKKLIAEAYAGEKLVLIENEFGEIGVDGGFMKDAGIEVTEMNSGCICCSLTGDFRAALHEVCERYAPDRILIEPSGVGKLSDIVTAVEQASDGELTINALCTVVDAGKCKMYMRNFGEFFNNQVESAGCIILSRTAGIKEEKLAECVALLREKNPGAVIITTPWDELSGAQILDAMEKRDTLTAALESIEREHEEDEDEHEHHHHHDHEHEEHEHHHHFDENGNCSCGCHHDDDDDDNDPVTIEGRGFNIDQTFNVTNKDNTAEVIVNIATEKGIENLIVKIESPVLTEDVLNAVNLPKEFDLANPASEELAQTLIGFGLLSKDKKIKGSTETTFDVSQFMPLLGGFENPGPHKFILTVKDSAGNNLSKTLTVYFPNLKK